jgi:hypothetical protein
MKKTMLQNKKTICFKFLLSFSMLFGIANAQFIGTAPSRNGSIGSSEYMEAIQLDKMLIMMAPELGI